MDSAANTVKILQETVNLFVRLSLLRFCCPQVLSEYVVVTLNRVLVKVNINSMRNSIDSCFLMLERRHIKRKKKRKRAKSRKMRKRYLEKQIRKFRQNKKEKMTPMQKLLKKLL